MVIDIHVDYFKATKGGKEIVGKTFRELAEEVGKSWAKDIAKDIAKDNVLEEKKMLAVRMLLKGRGSAEQIAEDLDLPIEMVETLLTNKAN